MNNQTNEEQSKCLNCGLPLVNSVTDSDVNTCTCNVDNQKSSIQICTICKKRIVEEGSASITQWLFRLYGCNCKQRAFRQESDPSFNKQPKGLSTEVSICTNCGKRIRKANEGSLTQWIFKSHMCSCGVPKSEVLESASADKLESASLSARASAVHKGENQTSTYLPEKFSQLKENQKLDGWEEDLDRYSPLKVLGKGAVGSVFLCYDKYLQKPVALKILNLVTNELIVSFQREAKAASKLNHPYIVKVLDFGTTIKGAPYMVMDYVEGVNLGEYVKKHGQLLVQEAIDLTILLCQSLSHAHKNGILHHDIKSSNIIICTSNNGESYPIVIDLGVAQVQLEYSKNEISEEIVGSASYLAPEYISGGNYDKRSEIYSLGCVLFEMLTGTVPYLGDSLLKTLDMHSNEELPTLGGRRDDLSFSIELEELVGKCLAKNSNLRYKSMEDLHKDLQLFQETDSYIQKSQSNQVFEPTSNTDLSRPRVIRKIVIVFLFVIFIGGFVVFYTVLFSHKKPVIVKEQQKLLNKFKAVPYKPDPVEEDGIEGYYAKHNLLVVPDTNTISRLAKAVDSGSSVERLELACIKLGPTEIALIEKLKPKILKLFRVSNISESNMAALSKISSIESLAIARSSKIDYLRLKRLASNGSIVSLTLQDCNLKNPDLVPVSAMKRLKVLDISLNPMITQSGLKCLSSSAIKKLNIFHSVNLESSQRKSIGRKLGLTIEKSRGDDVIFDSVNMVSDRKLQKVDDLLRELGQYYRNNGDYGISIEYYNASVRHSNHAGIVEAYERIGSVYEKSGQYNKAIEYFTRSIQSFEESGNFSMSQYYFISAKKRRARVYHLIGEDEKALKEINEVIELAKRNNELTGGMLNVRLHVLIALNMNLEALNDLDELINTKDNFRSLHSLCELRIKLLKKTGQTKEAKLKEAKLKEMKGFSSELLED